MFLQRALFFICASLILTSCSEEDEPETTELKTSGSIEMSIKTEHLNDSQDVLVIIKNVYDLHGNKRSIVSADTIPGLGMEVVQGENSEGQTMSTMKRKEYEFFVTVK